MQPDPDDNETVIAQIHRLFAESLPVNDDPFPWYLPAGGIADCNGLLDIPDDGDFIDAAVWHLHGSELSGRKHRRWLKRLSCTSRTSIIVAMRFKSAGRQHAVRVPGLWFALFLDPPGRSFLRKLPLGILDNVRRHLVRWRYRRAIVQQPTHPTDSQEMSNEHLPLRPAG